MRVIWGLVKRFKWRLKRCFATFRIVLSCSSSSCLYSSLSLTFPLPLLLLTDAQNRLDWSEPWREGFKCYMLEENLSRKHSTTFRFCLKLHSIDYCCVLNGWYWFLSPLELIACRIWDITWTTCFKDSWLCDYWNNENTFLHFPPLEVSKRLQARHKQKGEQVFFTMKSRNNAHKRKQCRVFIFFSFKSHFMILSN